jgi:hypothetical protein
MVRNALALALACYVSLSAHSADLPNGATLLDPDIVWDLNPDVVSERQENAFAISPDDRSIVYISKGAIWTCNITAGQPTKLVDLPNTKTAFYATPAYRGSWNALSLTRNGMDQHAFLGKLPKDLTEVCSLAWTPSQDGVVYGQRQRWQSVAEESKFEVLHVSQNGRVTHITTIRRERFAEPHEFFKFDVTRDRKYVVFSNGYAPFIWDVARNKPLASSFDLLVRSSTSGRFLGIEIDTRQLVLADEKFSVARRFNATFAPQRACALTWSSDERFAVCRTREEHPSQKWHGFRIDLQTGEKRDLDGPHFPEQWFFTGEKSEVVRIGKSVDSFGVYADGGGCGTYISILPDGNGEQRDLASFQRPRDAHAEFSYKAGQYPPVRVDSDRQLFAMAFPREAKWPGYRYFLVSRNGDKWPCGADDKSRRVAPYNVIAIANQGQTVVACDESRMFSIPVDTIKNAKQPIE